MRKTIMAAVALATMAAVPDISGARMEVGYCHGEVVAEGIGKVGKCDVSAAIILSEKQLKYYAGAEITGVRLYLAAIDNVEDLTAWVRDGLEGENIAAGTAAPQKGWQTVKFATPVKVDGRPVAVGFTVNQTKSSKCIALGGDVVSDGHYIAKKGDWSKISSPAGSVCVELEVEGDMVPESDLAVESVRLESTVVKSGEPLRLHARVRNNSLSRIDGFRYGLNFEKENYGANPGEYAGVLEPKQAVDIEMEASTVQVPADEDMPVVFNVEDSGIMANNVIVAPFGAYKTSYPRMLLLEEFTTELCPNCPRAITSIATAFENGYGEKMVAVAHHVGFYTDWLTLPEESDLLWFFGEEGSFAPAVMYDRTPRAYGLETPVESIGYYDTFSERLDEAVDQPGFVEIGLTAVRTDDGGVNIEVKAKAHPLLRTLLPEPCLTVMLTEDGIRHKRQAGISNPEFTHSHVSRGYLTGVFGDRFEFDEEGQYTWSKTITLDEEWNSSNMEAVAYVHAYDPADRTACGVQNVAATHISASGVGRNFAASVLKTEYFDLHGNRLAAPEKGISIERAVLEDGSVTTRKVLVR